MMKKIKKYIKQRINNIVEEKLNSIFEKKFDEYSYIILQLYQMNNAPKDMLFSHVAKETNINNIVERFEKLHIPVRKEKIIIDEFEAWMKKYTELTVFYEELGDVKIEKLLEHFLSSKYLDVDSSKIYIDIAAASSPFSTIMENGGGGGYLLFLGFIF